MVAMPERVGGCVCVCWGRRGGKAERGRRGGGGWGGQQDEVAQAGALQGRAGRAASSGRLWWWGWLVWGEMGAPVLAAVQGTGVRGCMRMWARTWHARGAAAVQTGSAPPRLGILNCLADSGRGSSTIHTCAPCSPWHSVWPRRLVLPLSLKPVGFSPPSLGSMDAFARTTAAAQARLSHSPQARLHPAATITRHCAQAPTSSGPLLACVAPREATHPPPPKRIRLHNNDGQTCAPLYTAPPTDRVDEHEGVELVLSAADDALPQPRPSLPRGRGRGRGGGHHRSGAPGHHPSTTQLWGGMYVRLGPPMCCCGVQSPRCSCAPQRPVSGWWNKACKQKVLGVMAGDHTHKQSEGPLTLWAQPPLKHVFRPAGWNPSGMWHQQAGGGVVVSHRSGGPGVSLGSDKRLSCIPPPHVACGWLVVAVYAWQCHYLHVRARSASQLDRLMHMRRNQIRDGSGSRSWTSATSSRGVAGRLPPPDAAQDGGPAIIGRAAQGNGRPATAHARTSVLLPRRVVSRDSTWMSPMAGAHCMPQDE